MKTLENVFVDYADVKNPDWFHTLCENLRQISRYQWELTNTWPGLFWRRKEYKAGIAQLKKENRAIVKQIFPESDYPENKYHFHFDFWRDPQKRMVAVFYIFKNEDC